MRLSKTNLRRKTTSVGEFLAGEGMPGLLRCPPLAVLDADVLQECTRPWSKSHSQSSCLSVHTLQSLRLLHCVLSSHEGKTLGGQSSGDYRDAETCNTHNKRSHCSNSDLNSECSWLFSSLPMHSRSDSPSKLYTPVHGATSQHRTAAARWSDRSPRLCVGWR